MLATIAAADSASTVRNKYSVFIYSEAEPHAMYAIYKQTLTLCVLQYIYIYPHYSTVGQQLTMLSVKCNSIDLAGVSKQTHAYLPHCICFQCIEM